MSRRKDPQPEAELPEAAPKTESAAETPFVAVDPVDPPPEPAPADPPPPAPPQVVVRRGSFLAPLLGGVVAAIGGFALSHFDLLGLNNKSIVDLAPLTSQLEQIQTRLSGLEAASGEVAGLSARIAQLETAPQPAPLDPSRLEGLESRLAAIEALPADGSASTVALTAKLAELEQRLAAEPQADASPELQRKLDAALARLDEAEATAIARAEESAIAVAAANRAAALDTLANRLSSGEPFATELAALNDPALSQVLDPVAETGIPTLTQLQDAFPEAARSALQISRDTSAEDGWGSRFLDFLAGQTGARPLTPLEGDTPEAILSRADFALSESRIADAVAELQSLEPTVKTAVDPWLVQAETHLSATAALQAARGE